MNVVYYSVNDWEYIETLKTTSNVIVLDGDTVLLDGGVRVQVGSPIGLVYSTSTDKIRFLTHRFMHELSKRGITISNFLEDCRNEQKQKE